MKKALVLLFAAALFSVTAPAALLIDNFDNSNATVVDNDTSIDTLSQNGVLGVLDGRRTLFAECADATLCDGSPDALDITTRVFNLTGSASFDSGVTGRGGFIYDGVGGLGLNGGLGYDFSIGTFLVDIIRFNPGTGGPQPGTQLRITLSDGINSNYEETDITSIGLLAISGPFAGVDLTKVLSITMEVRSASDSPDVTLDNFRHEVPEPGTYAMLGAGLVGLAMLRRRTAK